MTSKKIDDAAVEARIASASTLTPRGTHTSIDDIPFVEGKFSYDEISEAAFVKGAEWRINSVWHNTNEAPEIPRQVLVEHENGSVSICVLYKTNLRRDSWKRWAYIEDLLPTEK